MLPALVLAAALLAQAAVPADLEDAVWEAVRPALPFPAATDRNEPIDGSSTARWVVRRAHADERPLVAEVIANPLNRETQERAADDMAAIQREVLAAERRAQAEFDRALGETRASGRPTAVRGVTLDDEGVAGERADAEAGMTIEVETGHAEHVATIHGVDAPAIGNDVPGAAWVMRVPARTVRPSSADRDPQAHYYPAQAIVYFSADRPTVTEATPGVFTVHAPATAGDVVAVVLRGNRELVDSVIAGADWARLSARNR